MQIKSAISIVFLLIITAVIGVATITTIQYAPHAYPAKRLLNYKDTGMTLKDRNNEPFYLTDNAHINDYVPLDEIADPLEQAVVSTEDETFYRHPGISLTGIIRSAFLNVKEQSLSYGGSTLTQQLVKNTLLSSDRTISRKAQEALLALYVDRLYSKEEILEMYLNTVYYGEGAFGIAEASRTYFNKKPQELTLSEGAFLAGILKSPGTLASYSAEEVASVKKSVLTKMKEDSAISEEEYENALSHKLTFNNVSTVTRNTSPHYAQLVEHKLREMYGEDVIYEGLEVKTALNPAWQQETIETIDTFLAQRFSSSGVNGAAVIMNPTTGEVYAAVGSRNWFNEEFGKFNMAVSPRQPGSTFKPIVYSIAIDDRSITPASVLHDSKREFADDYEPENYDKRYRGRVTARYALANSLNVPSVEVMQKVGVHTVLNKADDFGIHSLREASDYGPSLVLGSGEVSLLEMTNAYSAFANKGRRVDPIFILEVKDKYGTVIYEHKPQTTRVMKETTAYLITSILSDERTRRETFGSILNVPFPAAVKTGTTDKFRDAWTIGYTPNLTVGVWVGHNDRTEMHNAPGSSAAAPIWKSLMTAFVDETPEFARPDGIVESLSCIPGSSQSARMEFFIEGTERQATCGRTRTARERDDDEGEIIETASAQETSPPPAIGGTGDNDSSDDEEKDDETPESD